VVRVALALVTRNERKMAVLAVGTT